MLLMEAACGREGRLLASEPNPLVAKAYLPANLALNGVYHGVEIRPKVVGNRDGQTVDFVLNEGDFAASLLERWAYSHRAEAIPLPMATVDRLCINWPRLDLVKIDAEGAEACSERGCRRPCVAFHTWSSSSTCTSNEIHRTRSSLCMSCNGLGPPNDQL